MRFYVPPKDEPVEIKMLQPGPFHEHYFDLREPRTFFNLCPIGRCPMCQMRREARYAQHELDRWADDGGR